MAPIIIDNKEQIVTACQRHGLKYLYIFGSAARGTDFNKDSDVEFLYACDASNIQFESYPDNYFDFRFGLEDLLKKNVDLVPEDLVTNPYLLRKINNDKVKLYG